MFSGESNGAEAKNSENIYYDSDYLNSSSHLNNTGKKRMFKKKIAGHQLNYSTYSLYKLGKCLRKIILFTHLLKFKIQRIQNT